MPRRSTKPKTYTTSTADVRPKPPATAETYATSTDDRKHQPAKKPGPVHTSET